MAPSRMLATIGMGLVVVTMGCGSDDDGDPTIANPASEFCIEQGGDLEIVDEEDGQVGYCNLPDGRRVEEWTFYNEETGATTP